ncbi:MAG: ABC transporter ATP-binding protein [Stagnimonas sp.]|jgi:ABC-type branched-subunit amino acid transport system ATPase component|nr:ABC transporter ATP-binding protein [Stagnimonas sp.]
MLAIRNLNKRFGGLHALRDVSIDAPPGQITAVIGPNGAGKSTLMNVISGFISPDGGSITVAGTPITGMKPHEICRQGLARTFQNLQMFSDMTVLETVITGRTRHRRASLVANLLMTPRVWHDEKDAAQHAQTLLETMQIGPSYWQRRAGDLPYGLQRRVEIARALATEPAYMLLDEPAAGLNDEESVALGSTLRELAGRGIGIVLIEHDIELVMNFSRHIFVMDAGGVIADGTPEQVRSKPEVVKAYLGDEHGA